MVGSDRCRSARGQASVELLAAVVVLVLVVAAAIGGLRVAQATWTVAAAARAAARAQALGRDPLQAARGRLPRSLRRRARVRATAGGGVRLTVELPAVLGIATGTVTAAARMEPQR